MRRKSLRFCAGVLVIGGLCAAGGCAHHHHREGHHPPHHGGRADALGLTVIGVGEAKAAPDLARTNIGIEVRDQAAEAAIAQANERMSAIIAAIKATGVADADVRTHDFSIAFERDFSPPQPVVVQQSAPAEKGPTKRAGGAATVTPAEPAKPAEPRGSYRVSNMVEVTVRDIAKVGQVITAATDAGANNVWDIAFDIENREPLHDQARAKAVARAQQSAAELARLSGVKLGRIVAIDDQPGSAGGPVYASALRMEKAAVANTPVERGELTVTHQVQLVYQLQQ